MQLSIHERKSILRRRFYRETFILFGLACFLIGLGAIRFEFEFSLFWLLLAASLLPVLILKRWFSFLVLGVLAFQIGLYRAEVVSLDLSKFEDLYGQEVTLQGRIEDDPTYANRGQTEFHIGGVSYKNEDLRGRVRVRALSAVGVQRGDSVEVTGRLYEGFGNRQGSISYAEVESKSRSNNPIETIRRQYFSSVYSSIPDPQASLGLGFLVGLRALLPDELISQLSITGLTHIVAVSGYNLTVLIRITRKLFFRFSRFSALVGSFALMAAFLGVTGGAPSIVRASVVAVIALLGWYFGRKVSPLMLLLCSAAITAGINPLYLWLDIGWWLSFLAFFGVLILAPALEQRLFRSSPKLLARTLLETTSAQIMALPLIVFIFGELSLISIFANLIILPLVPIAMLLTFVAGSAGLLIPQLSGWLAWPATIILSFMTEVIRWLSQVPGALIELNIDAQLMLLIYGAVLFILVLWTRKKARFSGTKSIIE